MILVFGTGRCGTSAVCRVLEQRCGVDFGGPGMERDANPEGTYERQVQVSLDQGFYTGDLSIARWAQGIQTLAAELEEPWGMKHPLNAHFINAYLAIFPEADIVWVTRDLQDATDSFSRVFGVDQLTAIQTVTTRHVTLRDTLEGMDIPHTRIDMTDRKSDDEIEDELRSSLNLHLPDKADAVA